MCRRLQSIICFIVSIIVCVYSSLCPSHCVSISVCVYLSLCLPRSVYIPVCVYPNPSVSSSHSSLMLSVQYHTHDPSTYATSCISFLSQNQDTMKSKARHRRQCPQRIAITTIFGRKPDKVCLITRAILHRGPNPSWPETFHLPSAGSQGFFLGVSLLDGLKAVPSSLDHHKGYHDCASKGASSEEKVRSKG